MEFHGMLQFAFIYVLYSIHTKSKNRAKLSSYSIATTLRRIHSRITATPTIYYTIYVKLNLQKTHSMI